VQVVTAFNNSTQLAQAGAAARQKPPPFRLARSPRRRFHFQAGRDISSRHRDKRDTNCYHSQPNGTKRRDSFTDKKPCGDWSDDEHKSENRLRVTEFDSADCKNIYEHPRGHRSKRYPHPRVHKQVLDKMRDLTVSVFCRPHLYDKVRSDD
jgi:hypothetical protein